MSNNDVAIEIPEELTETMEVITTVISPVRDDIGILIMGEDLHVDRKGSMPKIHLFQLSKTETNYNIEANLGAFAFYDYLSAINFVERLPEMSALEMLMLMNNQENASYH